ncbi:MAG: isocitrate/isopropylmalate dehydrogenase family protein [Geminicoccales bacterium]
MNTEFNIAVMPGDGIGREIMAVCLEVLSALEKKFGDFKLRHEILPAGAAHYKETGTAFSDENFKKVGEADAILLGAIGLPDVRYPDGTEISPHLEIRRQLDLYAGLRPVKAFPHAKLTLKDERAEMIDILILRESTEGLFASVGKGKVENNAVARDTLEITRRTSERLFDVAFKLAEKRQKRGGKGRVTCVDKANVFTSMAFFRKIFDERAANFPGIQADHHYVDATALDLLRKPWDFDVLVMENMFGDILSDLGAGLVGGMGMAPCAELGDRHGLFQPAHGSAPDIMGQDKANPTAMLLSASMMLDWLGEQHDVPSCRDASDALNEAIDRGYRTKAIWPMEQGGNQGTQAMAEAVINLL